MHPSIPTALLVLALGLASPATAQSPGFTLSGPTQVDFSRLPRTSAGEYIVRFTGTGFVDAMLLVATIGPYGPWLIPFHHVDSQSIEVPVAVAGTATVSFVLYKLDATNSVVATNPLTTHFGFGSALATSSVFVATTGSDSNPGTLAAPFRTIGRGLQALSPGMTLYIRGGTYFERPTVSASGRPGQPITIESYPGEHVVIDSGPRTFRTAGNADWELVNAGTGEWRSVAAAPSGTPYGYVAGIGGYENGRVGLVPYENADAFRATSETYVDETTPFYVGPGLFRDPGTGRLHVRLQKTSDMRAVEARYGQVFATDTPDPRTLSILVSQASSTLTIRGSHVVVRNLTVHQATRSINLPETVNDVRIENVEVWLGDSAVDSSGAGSSNLVVTRCRVYGDVPLWIFWTDAKKAPAPADRMRQTSLDFRYGAHDVELSFNHVRGGHDLIGVNTNEDRFFIHHNVLQNCHDDAAEFEGTVDIGRIEFHDNYVINPLVAVAPGQSTPATRGPILVYNNVFASLRSQPINRRPGIVTWNGGGRHGIEYMLKQHSGNTFYYNNTMVQLEHAGDGINIVPRRPENTYCMNNVLVMVNGKVNGSYDRGQGQVVDGNLYWKVNNIDTEPLTAGYSTVGQLYGATGLEQHGLGSAPRRGTDPQFATFQLNVVNPTSTVWAIDAASETHPITAFLLTPGSPARGAAMGVPSHPVFGPLPDAAASTDLGALPFGGAAGVLQDFPFDQVR